MSHSVRIALLLAALLLSACAQTSHHRADGVTEQAALGRGAQVLIVEPDIELTDLVTSCLQQPRADWSAAARAKELYWADWKREHGPAAGIRVADELRRQVLAARPDWPSESEREEDLATHLRMIEVIRRARLRPR